MGELKRAHGLGRLRVRGMHRVALQVALKATACNIKRWLRAYAAVLHALWALLYSHTPRSRTPVALHMGVPHSSILLSV